MKWPWVNSRMRFCCHCLAPALPRRGNPWRPRRRHRHAPARSDLNKSPSFYSAATSGATTGVSESAFARFVARELSPRFPDGLTITDATGQWRDPADGRLVHEAAKQVEIVLPGNADDEARLEAVVTAYKREFHQHSVGVIVQSACVSF